MAQRTVAWQLYIDWDGLGADDESARLIEAVGTSSTTAPSVSAISGRGIVSDCTLTLDNSDNRFSAANSGGALYSDLANGGAWQKEMYLNISIDGGDYYRVFTGVIKIPQESGVTARSTNTVTITCRGYEDVYLNKRVSTDLTTFAGWVDNPPTEAEVITQFMLDAGYTVDATYIDAGMFTIPFAWMDYESPIEECWALAAACGGRFYYDVRADEFTYENAGHWLLSPHETVLTSNPDNSLTRADFASFSFRYNDGDLFDKVICEYSGRQVGASTDVWTPDEAVIIPTASNHAMDVVLRQPVYVMDGVTFHATTAGGVDITSDVTAVLSDKMAMRATLTLTNNNATYAAYLHGVKITGQPIEGGPEGEASATSADSFWTGRTGRTRSVRTNMYVQSLAHAQMLASMLQDIHEAPRMEYTIGGCLGEPRRNLGDYISITDADILGGTTQYGWITSINWTLSVNGFVQTLHAVDSNDLFEHADATPSYFVIGTNKLGVWSNNLEAKVFY